MLDGTKQIFDKDAILNCFKCFPSYLRLWLFSAKGADVMIAYTGSTCTRYTDTGSVYIRDTCIRDTYISGICIGSTYIGDTCISTVGIVKCLEIYLQLFQILKRRLLYTDW